MGSSCSERMVKGGGITPQEITYLKASSTFMFKKIRSFRLNMAKNPEVGFGVVGIKTAIISSSHPGSFGKPSRVTKPIERDWVLGKGAMTTCLKEWVFAAKMVLMTS